jgi:ABC-type sugar transport system ATPase subunit
MSDDDEAEALARTRIAELGIRGQPRSLVSTLSGGNQQKVVLGKWLSRPPRLLLLDEPTRGVDVGAREEIYALIAALCRRGVAVLMASSDLPEVQRLADRIIVLRKGRVAVELPGGSSQDHIVAHSTGLNPSC